VREAPYRHRSVLPRRANPVAGYEESVLSGTGSCSRPGPAPPYPLRAGRRHRGGDAVRLQPRTRSTASTRCCWHSPPTPSQMNAAGSGRPIEGLTGPRRGWSTKSRQVVAKLFSPRRLTRRGSRRCQRLNSAGIPGAEGGVEQQPDHRLGEPLSWRSGPQHLGPPKTAAGRRVIAIPPHLVRALEDCRRRSNTARSRVATDQFRASPTRIT
jgi:hypothetical protein